MIFLGMALIVRFDLPSGDVNQVFPLLTNQLLEPT